MTKRVDFEEHENEQKLPLKWAVAYILGSALLLWTLVFSGTYFYRHLREKRAQDERYKIVGLYQRCNSIDSLPTQYLAELLYLSSDKPTNLYAFSAHKAEKKLQSLPLFKRARVRAAKPGVVFVEYELRRPIARISDFENIGISEDKYLFPLTPFYTPKNLPEIYLGQEELEVLDPKRVELAFELMEIAKNVFPAAFTLKRIDLGQAFSMSANREIVLCIEERQVGALPYSFLVRLSSRDYQKSIENFFAMRPSFLELQKKEQLKEQCCMQVVDLRVAHIALVKSVL